MMAAAAMTTVLNRRSLLVGAAVATRYSMNGTKLGVQRALCVATGWYSKEQTVSSEGMQVPDGLKRAEAAHAKVCPGKNISDDALANNMRKLCATLCDVVDGWQQKCAKAESALVLEREAGERLRAALIEAAMSLETIDEHSGREPELKRLDQIRGYAHGRAGVARAALAAARAAVEKK